MKYLALILLLAGCACTQQEEVARSAQPLVKKEPAPVDEPLHRLARERTGFVNLTVGMPAPQAMDAIAGSFGGKCSYTVYSNDGVEVVLYLYSDDAPFDGVVILCIDVATSTLTWARNLILVGHIHGD